MKVFSYIRTYCTSNTNEQEKEKDNFFYCCCYLLLVTESFGIMPVFAKKKFLVCLTFVPYCILIYMFQGCKL